MGKIWGWKYASNIWSKYSNFRLRLFSEKLFYHQPESNRQNIFFKVFKCNLIADVVFEESIRQFLFAKVILRKSIQQKLFKPSKMLQKYSPGFNRFFGKCIQNSVFKWLLL